MNVSTDERGAAADATPRRGPGWAIRLLTGRGWSWPARWAYRLFVLLPLVVGMAALALTRGPGLRWSLSMAARWSAGVTLRCDAARFTGDGWLEVEGARVRVPGLSGGAGELASIGRARVQLDWSSWWRGGVRAAQVRLESPVLRLSQSVGDGSWNFSRLGMVSGAGRAVGPGAGAARLPRVEVSDGLLEVGEDRAGRFEPLWSTRLGGSLRPIDARTPVYDMVLHGLGAATGPGGSSGGGAHGGVEVAGRFDLSVPTLSVEVGRVSIAEWSEEATPTRMRALWRALALRGELTSTRLSYSPAAGLQAEMTLKGGAMNLPIPDDRPDAGAAGAMGPDPRPMSLTDVDGTLRLGEDGVRANITGLVEDLRCQLNVRTEGLSLDAPVRCEIISDEFVVAKRPRLLPFAPSLIRRRFADFSGPTAIVDLRMVVTRGRPTGGARGDLSVSGSLRARNGAAAFAMFPYPVSGLSAYVRFDDRAIELVKITGRGPTGAKLLAHGIIAPPAEATFFDLDIAVTDVPVDEVLEASIPAERRGIVRELFSVPGYAALRAGGLVSPASAAVADAGTENGHGVDAGGRPAFDLGGRGECRVRVILDESRGLDYATTIDFRMKEGWLVPAAFPLPVRAENMLLHVTDSAATLGADRFTTVGGGRVEIAAAVGLEPGAARATEPAGPEVRIRARGIPVDELLIGALPDRLAQSAVFGPPPPGAGARSFSPRRLLRALGASGVVSCEATVGSISGSAGVPDFDVRVDLTGVRADPPGASDAPAIGGPDSGERLALRLTSGELRVTNDAVTLSGLACSVNRIDPGAAEPVPAGAMRMQLRADSGWMSPGANGAGGADAWEGRAEGHDLDLRARYEDLIEAVSPDAAAELGALRARRRPAARFDAAVEFRGKGEADPLVVLSASRIRDAEVDALGGRLRAAESAGGVSIELSPRRVTRFDGLEGEVSFDGVRAGFVRANGVLPLTKADEAPDRVEIGVRAGGFQSRLVSALLERGESGLGLAEAAGEWSPAGEFDLDAVVISTRGRGVQDPARAYEGVVRPRALEVRRATGRAGEAGAEGSERIAFERVEGLIRFDARGGRLEGLRAGVDGWSVGLDGAWTRDAGAGVSAELDWTLATRGLPDSLRACVPAGVRNGLARLGLTAEGPVVVRDGHVTLTGDADASGRRGVLTGTIEFEGVGAEPSIRVRDAAGSARVSVEWGAEPAASLASIELRADRMRAAGLALADAAASIGLTRDGADTRIEIPRWSASCHGGRLSGAASVRVDESGAGRYEVSGDCSGVRFADVLADLRPEGPGPDAGGGGADDTRGWLSAWAALSGRLGDRGSRVGRAEVRVRGGDVVRLPLVLQLVELSNLALPMGDRLDSMRASLFVLGDTLTAERVVLASNAITIEGGGTARWPGPELALRFNSRAKSRIPLWSDAMEALRNEIVTTTVTGTPGEPKFGTETLSGARQLLGSFLRARPDDRGIGPGGPGERVPAASSPIRPLGDASGAR